MNRHTTYHILHTTAVLILALSRISSAYTGAITRFNTGEVSPLMEGRIEFAKYTSACRELENMLALPQGPATRRPGTKYIAAVGDANYPARLMAFEYSKSDTYMLEMGDLYMRVFRNGGQVLDANSDPYELVTPFEDSEVFELQADQDADTMYIVHPNHPPQVLTRTGHTAWTIGDFDIQDGPFLDENAATDSNITPSGTTGTITLTATKAPFVAGHVGALWRISHRKETTSLNGVIDANESSDTIAVSGDYTYNISGTFTGTVTLERSYNNGTTWEATDATRYSNNAEINEDYPDSEEDDGVIYRVTGYDPSAWAGSATYNLQVFNYMHNGYVRISGYVGPNEVNAVVLSELGDTNATSTWAEGAWSDYRGWPHTVALHELRLCFGATDSYPQTFWASATEDYNNFAAGSLADDSFAQLLPGMNPIQWMTSQSYLMVGTLGGAGRLGKDDEGMTPGDAPWRSQPRGGAAYQQAVLAGDAVIYVERGATKLRELVYSLEKDRYVAPDLSVLAPHICADGITQIAVQDRPDVTLWAVTGDGALASLTYQREHEVVAWARHTTVGTFESVGVIPSSGEDEVWVTVNRTIDGSTARYVEQMQPRDWGGDQNDCFFLDSGLTFDGGDAVSITNITKANPAVVTVSTWPTDGDGDNLADGDQVLIMSVGGMTEVNERVYTISEPNTTDKTFELRSAADDVNITSAAFTAYTSGGTVLRVENTFTNLAHLEGETVTVWADGRFAGTETVSGGSITLDEWVNTAAAGLPYTSQLETMPVMFDTQEGASAPWDKRMSEVVIDFYETLSCSAGASDDDVVALTFDGDDSPTAPVTDFVHHPMAAGYWDKAAVYLETSQPGPMTVRAIYPIIH